MAEFLLFIFALIAVSAIYMGYSQNSRRRHIDSYQFPVTIKIKLKEKYPHLDDEQVLLVLDGLREYFHVCRMAGKNMVAMPSKVVDTAWHEFILFTKKYQMFCQSSLGRFLHHTPAEGMASATVAQESLKRAWRIACVREKIDPRNPKQIPLLFSMDAQLSIPDGFIYDAHAALKPDPTGNIYYAGDIDCTSDCASDSDSSSSGSSCSSCGGGD